MKVFEIKGMKKFIPEATHHQQNLFRHTWGINKFILDREDSLLYTSCENGKNIQIYDYEGFTNWAEKPEVTKMTKELAQALVFLIGHFRRKYDIDSTGSLFNNMSQK